LAVCRFELHAQPLALDYDEFERLLLGLALLQARVRKRVDAFDDVLGELLDSVYKKAGVLLGLDQQQQY
jgi:type VI protein secretion system component VasA